MSSLMGATKIAASSAYKEVHKWTPFPTEPVKMALLCSQFKKVMQQVNCDDEKQGGKGSLWGRPPLRRILEVEV